MDGGRPTAITWSIGTVVAYLGLYTSYSKVEKKLRLEKLTDVLVARQGFDAAAVEWNKVLSLAGLTNLGLSFMPGIEQVVSDSRSLMRISTAMLLGHSIYSIFKYYGSPNIPTVSSYVDLGQEIKSDRARDIVAVKRKISVLCGLAGQVVIEGIALDLISLSPLPIVSALGFGVAHFYFMEVDYKGAMAVRPFGYVAFVGPILAVTGLALKNMF